MKRIIVALSLILLAACHSVAPADPVGSPAWMESVDRRLSVSDGQGHGPDYGSQEWCDAVYFRLHGWRAAEPVPCDQAWMEEIDKALGER